MSIDLVCCDDRFCRAMQRFEVETEHQVLQLFISLQDEI
jgi:hypothetical protein